MKNIVLMGIKHCGKSTQGKLLAQKLSEFYRQEILFYDTDTVLEELSGKTAREVFTEQGEETFKALEALSCNQVMQRLLLKKQNAVIATGGGICNNFDALNVLHKESVFVFLNTEEKTACERIIKESSTDEDGRLCNLPAYIAKKNPHTINDVRNIFHDFYEERCRLYSGIADVSVTMAGEPKEVNTERLFLTLKSNGAL